MLTFMVAGHETTSNALAWAFYLLSQNPRVEEKLREEVVRAGPAASPACELHGALLPPASPPPPPTSCVTVGDSGVCVCCGFVCCATGPGLQPLPRGCVLAPQRGVKELTWEALSELKYLDAVCNVRGVNECLSPPPHALLVVARTPPLPGALPSNFPMGARFLRVSPPRVAGLFTSPSNCPLPRSPPPPPPAPPPAPAPWAMCSGGAAPLPARACDHP